jgi:K+-transporting ATPase ATPase C chain
MENALSQFRAACAALLSLTILCGIVYPAVITAFAELAMPHQARGSLIERDGVIVGSELIGQSFDRPEYLWGRPSATAPAPNTSFNATTATGSSGSNLGPTNPALIEAARSRAAALRAGGFAGERIPSDLVLASGSGLDPHISPAAAEAQVSRIAAARGIASERVRAIIADRTEERTFGILGEPRVNVLLVNLALDRETATGGDGDDVRSRP